MENRMKPEHLKDIRLISRMAKCLVTLLLVAFCCADSHARVYQFCYHSGLGAGWTDDNRFFFFF